MATQPTFPAEIICHILKCSNPRDVVRWRAVSVWFCAVTYDSTIWKALYTNSSLPRPPGPFPFQSTAYLERTLIRTEKLVQSWTTRPMRDVSCVEFRVGQQPSGPVKLLGGRWLIGCESARFFVLHDVDADTESHMPKKQVIWEQENSVLSWDVSSRTRENGQFVMYVLLSEKQLNITRWRLLEFCLNGESGKLCCAATFDVPASEFESSVVELEGGKSPFLCIPGANLVFDTRTGMFYEFPEFHVALDETRYKAKSNFNDPLVPDYILLTGTHVIALYRYPYSHGLPVTLIQAFTVPLSGCSMRNSSSVLYLSHEGVSDRRFDHVTLLRNPMVDPITGSTTLRLLECTDMGYDLDVMCDDLILPKPSGDEVLPITFVVDRNMGKNERLHKFKLGSCSSYTDCSERGLLRGFYRKHVYNFSEDLLKAHPIMKFTIDATGDECMLVIGELSTPQWNCIEDQMYYWTGIAGFDASGRLCVLKPIDTDDSEAVVVVVDIE